MAAMIATERRLLMRCLVDDIGVGLSAARHRGWGIALGLFVLRLRSIRCSRSRPPANFISGIFRSA